MMTKKQYSRKNDPIISLLSALISENYANDNITRLGGKILLTLRIKGEAMFLLEIAGVLGYSEKSAKKILEHARKLAAKNWIQLQDNGNDSVMYIKTGGVKKANEMVREYKKILKKVCSEFGI